jgi:hypothetical protein
MKAEGHPPITGNKSISMTKKYGDGIIDKNNGEK